MGTGRGASGPQGLGYELATPAFNSLVDIGAIGGRLESGADGGGEIGAGAHNTTGNLAARAVTAASGQNYTIAIDNVNAAGAAVGTIEWRDRGDSTNGGQSLVQLPRPGGPVLERPLPPADQPLGRVQTRLVSPHP